MLDGRLMVSDMGRIQIVSRYPGRATKPRLGVKRRSRKDASHVYWGISIRGAGNLKVHRLVCEAFHGPPPFDNAVVLHLDEDALNNCAANLRWGTQQENMNMPKLKDYHRSRVGDDSARRKGMF